MRPIWCRGDSALKPVKTAVFDWHLTAVQPGAWVVNWRVAAGLFGHARPVLAGGGVPRGSLRAQISARPAQAYVNNRGHIVTTPKRLSSNEAPSAQTKLPAVWTFGQGQP